MSNDQRSQDDEQAANDTQIPQFTGFEKPSENWSKLPHRFIDLLPIFSSMAELKVVLYILRHTWGYQEYDDPKMIAAEEFANGRKRRDGSRLDSGVGMNEQAIRDGLKRAIAHGFIQVDTDDSDKGRIQKSYSLVMQNQGDENHPSDPRKSSPRVRKITPRTEKDTSGKKPKKKTFSYPSSLKRWEWKHIEAFEEAHSDITGLAGYFSDMQPNLKMLPTCRLAQTCVELFQELERNAVRPDQYALLMDYATRRFKGKYDIFSSALYALPDFVKSEVKTLQAPALASAVEKAGDEAIDPAAVLRMIEETAAKMSRNSNEGRTD